MAEDGGSGVGARTYACGQLRERVRNLGASRAWILDKVGQDLATARTAESRLGCALGRPVSGWRILEIGPGQGRERARYLAERNDVSCLDLDVYPVLRRPRTIYTAVQHNGWRRAVKSLTREVVVERANRAAWAGATGTTLRSEPRALVGDVCDGIPESGSWDAIVSWSVFEHLAEPKRALANVVDALKPGGAFLLDIHLWTANNGHHDLRACLGDEEALPFWSHLRDSTKHLVRPSSYLNQWRLAQWRELFAELAPGCLELLAGVRYDAWPTGLREELVDYSDEELLTVTAQYVWRKRRR
jgi:SAM-dependent methyltransferase